MALVNCILLSVLPVRSGAMIAREAAPKNSADIQSDRRTDFRATLLLLWFRQITLAILAFVFSEGLLLASGKAQGWTYFLPSWEVGFEVVVRLVAVALAGIAVGTLYTLIVAPFLWYFSGSRERVVDWATKVAVVLALFLVSRFALTTLISWSYQISGHRRIFDRLLLAGHALGFAIALCIPRTRKQVIGSLDDFLSEKMTRRAALATVGGAAALVVTEFALGKRAAVVKAALIPKRPKSNFLLITFDALNAEDMSLFGFRLPTTPNLDAFAGKSTVFTNFFSASTFTTPGLGAVLTGMYPTENRLYHMEAQARGEDTKKSLPHLMRAGGYATGAFLSNPLAYYLAKSFESEFDVLPEPSFRRGTLQFFWNATRPFHQDSGIGSRLDEYFELDKVWNFLGRTPHNLSFRIRPTASFDHARQVMAELPDGFFLWIHVLAPHDPYIPDSADRGRFIPDAELRTFIATPDRRWQPHYKPDQQASVDKHRLAYDEYVASADRAFGAFISDLERGGKLQDTTVIVSADHGESFEGGVFQHRSAYQTRPVIHVPLIVRRPGQQDGRRIGFTADQTALAPTILELAGLAQPNWMRAQSLVKWLNGNAEGEGEGLAFTQYLEKNSLFKPLRHGTVGVIDSTYQYVLDLETDKGTLRPLKEAQIWDLDRSAEEPKRAEALRAAIYARFPELRQKST
jgi:arylsulfatase A-like enzyme